MERYEKGEMLGEGTFGVVFKAIAKEAGQVVAIKKVRLGKAREGVNVTALREIKLLKELHSPYIVQLIDVFQHKRNLSLVFEFCETDLEAVIKERSIILSPADVKSFMQMILRALEFCHRNWVLHRDIKPNNFLMAPNGELKLADFGLARLFGSPDRKYTNQVFALWYRPPELLYGSTMYSSSIDMWAAGCVFAELLLRRPWFQGTSDIDQLSKIFQVLGTPDEATWRGCTYLHNYMPFHPTQPQPLRSVFPQASEDALDLLSRLVSLDPRRRISAADALRHRYFACEPPPTPPAQLPRVPPRLPNPMKQPLQGDTGPGSASMPPPAPGRPREREAATRSPLSDSNGPPAPGEPPRGKSGMSSVVKKMTLSSGVTKRQKASDGSAVPSRFSLPHGAHDARGAGTGTAPVAARNGGAAGSRGGGDAHDAHLGETPRDAAGFVDMPAGGTMAFRDQMDSADLASLRKRKLDMDCMFSEAGTPQGAVAELSTPRAAVGGRAEGDAGDTGLKGMG